MTQTRDVQIDVQIDVQNNVLLTKIELNANMFKKEAKTYELNIISEAWNEFK